MGNKRKRLTIIVNNIASFGGGEIFALAILKKLKMHFDITILNIVSKNDIIRIGENSLRNKYGLSKVKVVDINALAIKSRAFGDVDYNLLLPKPGSVFKLLHEVKDSDIIYNISSNPVFLTYVVIASKLFGKKLVQGVHNYSITRVLSKEQDKSLSSRLYRYILSNIGYFHVLNTTDQRQIKNAFPKAGVYLVPNFLTYAKTEVRANDKKFIVIFVGRLSVYEKGLDLLSKIVDSTLSKCDDIIFHIVGSGSGSKLVEGIVKRHKKNVKLLGFLKQSELGKIYRDASLFISTSRFETFQLTVVEAQAYGLPVVTFDAAGPKDIIKEKFQGSCVYDFDINKFSNEIVRHFDIWKTNKRKYSSEKIKIARNIIRHYSYNAVTKRIMRVLMEIVDKK